MDVLQVWPVRVAPASNRITVTCDRCGHRNILERLRRREPETIHVICHQCERPLIAEWLGKP